MFCPVTHTRIETVMLPWSVKLNHLLNLPCHFLPRLDHDQIRNVPIRAVQSILSLALGRLHRFPLVRHSRFLRPFLTLPVAVMTATSLGSSLHMQGPFSLCFVHLTHTFTDDDQEMTFSSSSAATPSALSPFMQAAIMPALLALNTPRTPRVPGATSRVFDPQRWVAYLDDNKNNTCPHPVCQPKPDSQTHQPDKETSADTHAHADKHPPEPYVFARHFVLLRHVLTQHPDVEQYAAGRACFKCCKWFPTAEACKSHKCNPSSSKRKSPALEQSASSAPESASRPLKQSKTKSKSQPESFDCPKHGLFAMTKWNFARHQRRFDPQPGIVLFFLLLSNLDFAGQKMPYVCEFPYCGQAFSRSELLVTHRKNEHVGADPRDLNVTCVAVVGNKFTLAVRQTRHGTGTPRFIALKFCFSFLVWQVLIATFKPSASTMIE